jgi:hypothetical protein
VLLLINDGSHVTDLVDQTRRVRSEQGGPCTNLAYKGLEPSTHFSPEALTLGFPYLDIYI